MNLYPLYEFPALTFVRDPVLPWKFAMDFGYALSLGFNKETFFTPNTFSQALHIGVYIRVIGSYIPLGLGHPDYGITVGVHLHSLKKKASNSASGDSDEPN